MFKFQKLDVWKKSIIYCKKGFKIADDLPQHYQFSIGEQLRRALLSISNNIAEGSGRATTRDQASFYNVAKASVYETINIYVVLSELNLLNLSIDEKRDLYNEADEICRMLSGLSRRGK